LIDKTDFPMMMAHSNALYLSYEHPSAAVLHDREWVRYAAADASLTLTRIIPPVVRNFQWTLLFEMTRPELLQAAFPVDDPPIVRVVTPPMPIDAHRIGRDSE
jgi:hypothetical protein